MSSDPIEIVVPQVGEAVAEVLLTEWYKREGDKIQPGDVLFEVDTDKAVVEVEAFAEGILTKILVPNHSSVMPQQVVALLTPVGAPATAEPPPPPVAQNGHVDEEPLPKNHRPSPVAQRMATDLGVDLAHVIGSGPGGKIVAMDVRAAAAGTPDEPPARGPSAPRSPVSPKARRLAASLGLDLALVQGTGPDGLITVDDVELAADGGNGVAEAAPEPAVVAPGAPAALPDGIEPYSKLRQTIATHMVASKRNVPHFYLMAEVDMTQSQGLRAYCRDVLGAERPPTYTSIITRACALALRDLPQLNVFHTEQGLGRRQSIDIGVAVNVADGLIVPIIRGADRLTLDATNRAIAEAAGRARSGRLRPDDMGPKSLSISNLGMAGIDAFVAIIDEPDPMILAVGRVAERVVPVEGQIVIRPMSTLTLSVDHRVLDGMQGAEFLMRVKQHLENPFELLGAE
jgi:pyruvate dehydrogenase E2 component (dihydrolipoamide acetyltransferase)